MGLAPRPLQHGDVVQLGRLTLRFRLELAGWAGRALPGQPETEELNADDADFQSQMNADFYHSCYYKSAFIRAACIRVIRVRLSDQEKSNDPKFSDRGAIERG